jgi:hypothetical protein
MQFTTAGSPTKSLGEVDFTITAGGAFGDGVLVAYVIATPFGSSNDPHWVQEGIARTASDGGFSSSTFSIENFPEPSGIAPAIAALGLLRRRRPGR